MLIRPTWQVRGAALDPNISTLLMGIVNVTPDSFSDGGLLTSVDAAIEAGLQMVREGAHIVDVGGESTRPGAEPVPADEELRRVMPVVEGLVGEGVLVSVDTSKPDVAARAIEAGAAVINDVAGFRAPGMAEVCADGGVGVVVMHMLGEPRTMQDDPQYDDVVKEILDYLDRQADTLVAAGVAPGAIAIDPGIGFGKTMAHNLELLGNIRQFAETGRPVLVGTSRKGFLGRLTGRPAAERDVATAATVAAVILQGASIVRVHNVGFAADAAAIADAMVSPGSEGDGNRTQAT